MARSRIWIFLDIDGVLVPEKTFDNPTVEGNFLRFDPICLGTFEGVLTQYPNASVAISSSWREVVPFQVIRSLFSPNIAQRIVGSTPFLDPKRIHQLQYLRHQEVLGFLQQQNASDEPWVAIDDIPEHYPPDAPVVVTDAYHGFDADAALALELHLLAM